VELLSGKVWESFLQRDEVKKTYISPDPRSAPCQLRRAITQPEEGGVKMSGNLKKAISVGTMSWVVAVFQEGAFAEEA
jgi:hypothetical protein